MKNICLFSIIMVLLPLPALAQKTTSLSTCGDRQETIVWQEKKTNEKIYLTVIQENEQQEYVMNKSFLSAYWSCSYYFAPATLNFVGYKGVNGKSGTPETIIKKVK